MDPNGVEPDRPEPAYLEEEPLMTTSRHEIMSYLVPQPGQAEEDSVF